MVQRTTSGTGNRERLILNVYFSVCLNIIICCVFLFNIFFILLTLV